MSKHNRERRQRWQCLKCRAPMHSELHGHSRNALKRDAKPTDVVHICGACQALHCIDGVRTLRLLTPAEEFALRFEMPNAMATLPATCALVSSPAFPGLGLVTIAHS